ncbi:MAG: hypothetical protein R8K21_04655 [Mariprofundales bacterium]
MAIIIVFGGGYLAAAHYSGGNFYDFGLGLGGDCGYLRENTRHFWEDIEYKDFKKAASYHEPAQQDLVDIPFLLERMFMQKPESLDIMAYDIVFCKVDSSQLRARLKSRVKVKDLIHGKIREQEFMFFYHRKDSISPWFMQLESSLRQLSPDQNKRH